ncbi:hypothetical protein GALMADRAFT_281058 [Galerina marginata CBS 339.88]|uniref:Transcription regulator Rua1 C-terminal domain-containing protein n=1 Tax=Galerina marginata (strain CBS 339.88) TaxID=685588 RepID=A0A067SPA4_GALM3|nr:hypothetical protein GALMADRAFT_281058 [Galerina marginata CBS 339.88]
MSSTDAALAWLLSVDAACTSSPVPTSASPDFTDWLRISPTTDSPDTQPTSQPQSSSPPFKDVSSSSRVNLPQCDGFGLNYLYDLPDFFDIENNASSGTGTDFIPSSVSPIIFSHHHRMLSLDSTSETVINTPSPRHLATFSPSGTIVDHNETRFSPTKFMQELYHTSFGNYYHDLTAPYLLADPISDISPVVRGDKLQESVPPDDELIPDIKPRRKKKNKRTRNLPRPSSFVERLHAAPSSSKPPSTPSSSRTAVKPLLGLHSGSTEDNGFPPAVLLSPCHFVSNESPSGSIRDTPQVVTMDNSSQDATSSITIGPELVNTGSASQVTDILSPLSPLTPLSSSADSPLPPRIVLKLKRKFGSFSTPVGLSKRPRLTTAVESPISLSSPLSSAESSSEKSSPDDGLSLGPSFTVRTLPASLEVAANFSLFYRRFPASSYYQPGHLDSPCTLFGVAHPGGIYNAPRSALDLYTPRFVKGKGVEKVGLCPICAEPHARGGQNKKIWFAMKFSAFKCYHMQYAHGISASTGQPFSPPTAFRTLVRPSPGKNEKLSIQQGKCHKCAKWVAVEGIKDMESKVKELHWWKHAAACHHGTTLEGEGDYYEEDYILTKISSLKPEPA